MGSQKSGNQQDFEQVVTKIPLTDAPAELDLHLRVEDQEIIQELLPHEAGGPREQFALSALRLGILAFRQASGQLDAGTLRNEGERLFRGMEGILIKYTSQTQERVSAFLKQYFDPTDGNLPVRLEKLVKHDGEIAMKFS